MRLLSCADWRALWPRNFIAKGKVRRGNETRPIRLLTQVVPHGEVSDVNIAITPIAADGGWNQSFTVPSAGDWDFSATLQVEVAPGDWTDFQPPGQTTKVRRFKTN